ncbi:MAG: hypothetical protein ABIF19_08685 [Planctomycetota bacterium]
MRPAKWTSAVVVVVVALALALSGGCAGMKGSEIYGKALGGALVGGIIGYQSGEATAGALIGAAIVGVGEFLHQADQLEKKQAKEGCQDGCGEKIIVEVHNSNGSVTQVVLKKKGDAYIGPKGERYEELPDEEQLKPVYGL